MLKLNRRINASVFLGYKNILIVNQLGAYARVEPFINFHNGYDKETDEYCFKQPLR